MNVDQPDGVNRFVELDHSVFRLWMSRPEGGRLRPIDIHLAMGAWSRDIVECCAVDAELRRSVLTVLRGNCDEHGRCDDALIGRGARKLGCSERMLRRWLEHEIRRTSGHKDEGDLA